MRFTEEELFYEKIARSFDEIANHHELEKRLRIVFEELLQNKITGKKFLDAGCGTGYFAKVANEMGAKVTALDVGSKLLAEVRKKCKVKTIIGDICNLPFGNNTFDIVLATEVIEHTRNPKKAVTELCRVTKKGGVLILTTVNSLWAPLVNFASFLRLRPYHGFEYPPKFKQLLKQIEMEGFKIEKVVGFNFLPFFWTFFDFFDNFEKVLLPIMVNIGIRAKNFDEKNF